MEAKAFERWLRLAITNQAMKDELPHLLRSLKSLGLGESGFGAVVAGVEFHITVKHVGSVGGKE